MSSKNFSSRRAFERHMAGAKRKQEIKQTKGKAMSDKKLTKEEIDQEYTQLCAQLGDIEVKRDVLAMQENTIKHNIRLMQKQAHEQQIADMQAKAERIEAATEVKPEQDPAIFVSPKAAEALQSEVVEAQDAQA